MRWRGVEIDRHCLERDARAWRHGVWLVEALRDGGRRLEGLEFKSKKARLQQQGLPCWRIIGSDGV